MYKKIPSYLDEQVTWDPGCWNTTAAYSRTGAVGAYGSNIETKYPHFLNLKLDLGAKKVFLKFWVGTVFFSRKLHKTRTHHNVTSTSQPNLAVPKAEYQT